MVCICKIKKQKHVIHQQNQFITSLCVSYLHAIILFFHKEKTFSTNKTVSSQRRKSDCPIKETAKIIFFSTISKGKCYKNGI